MSEPTNMINMNSYHSFDFLDKPAGANPSEPTADAPKAGEFNEIFAGLIAAPVSGDAFKTAERGAEISETNDEFSENFAIAETSYIVVSVTEKPLPNASKLTLKTDSTLPMITQTAESDGDASILPLLQSKLQTATGKIAVEAAAAEAFAEQPNPAVKTDVSAAKNSLTEAIPLPPVTAQQTVLSENQAAVVFEKIAPETSRLTTSENGTRNVESNAPKPSLTDIFAASANTKNEKFVRANGETETLSPTPTAESVTEIKFAPENVLFSGKNSPEKMSAAPLPTASVTAVENNNQPPAFSFETMRFVNLTGETANKSNREIAVPNAPHAAESEAKITPTLIKGFFTEFTKNESNFEPKPIVVSEKTAPPVDAAVSTENFSTAVKTSSPEKTTVPETAKLPVSFENPAGFKAQNSEALMSAKTAAESVQMPGAAAERSGGGRQIQSSPQMPTNWRVRKNSVAPNSPDFSGFNIRTDLKNLFGSEPVKPLPSAPAATVEPSFVIANLTVISADTGATEANFFKNSLPVSLEMPNAADGKVKIAAPLNASENSSHSRIEGAPPNVQGMPTANTANIVGAVEKTVENGEDAPAIFFEQLSMAVKKPLKAAETLISNPSENHDVFEQIEKPLLQAAILNAKTDEPEILKLRLRPAELGMVEIKLEKTDSGAIKVHFQTETEAARHVLADSFEQLKNSLEKSGWRVEQIEVAANYLSTNNSGERQPRGGEEHQARRTNAANLMNEAANFGGNAVESGDLKLNPSNRLLSVRA